MKELSPAKENCPQNAKLINMPTLEIDLGKIRQNTANLIQALDGIELVAVTKCCHGDRKVAKAMIEGGAKVIADSQLANIEALKDLKAQKMLLRAPLRSEDVRLLDLVDFVMVSNLGDLKRLNKKYQGKKNIGVILNVETGFGREGFDPKELKQAQDLISSAKLFSLSGMATNTACQNGTNPLKQLNRFTNIIRPFINSPLPTSHFPLIISGGSSSVLPWVLAQQIPKGINQVRIGEAILLGHDTVNYKTIASNSDDAFSLKAEILEVKEKQGTWQALIAVGISQIGAGRLYPHNKAIKIKKAYSDYLIVSSTQNITCEYLFFKPDYYALLALMGSSLVKKKYLSIR